MVVLEGEIYFIDELMCTLCMPLAPTYLFIIAVPMIPRSTKETKSQASAHHNAHLRAWELTYLLSPFQRAITSPITPLPLPNQSPKLTLLLTSPPLFPLPSLHLFSPLSLSLPIGNGPLEMIGVLSILHGL